MKHFLFFVNEEWRQRRGRGEIFTRVKASTRGRELSRRGAKLIFPAAEEGGEGCAHARDAPLPVHEQLLADFSISVRES